MNKLSKPPGKHRMCPPHPNVLGFSEDPMCHGHESTAHQINHNAHCEALGCPYACKGTDRHEDAPVLPARSLADKTVNILTCWVPDFVWKTLCSGGHFHDVLVGLHKRYNTPK